MKLQVRIFLLSSIAYGVVGRPADALATDDSASTDVVKAETPGPSGSSVANLSYAASLLSIFIPEIPAV
ncbi:hypothetical protein H0H92_011028, partial [Tricholoma furcatifolium]